MNGCIDLKTLKIYGPSQNNLLAFDFGVEVVKTTDKLLVNKNHWDSLPVVLLG
jgi:hypothetical protein